MTKDLNYLIATAQSAVNGTLPKSMPNTIQMEYIAEAAREKAIPPIDLAGMKLTRDAAMTIDNLQKSGIVFVDTENNGRTAVLNENVKRIKQMDVTSVPFPKYTVDQDLADFIDLLSQSTPYKFAQTDKLTFAAALFFMTTYPNAQIEVTDKDGKEFLKWIHSALKMTEMTNEDEFFAIIDADLATSTVDIVTHDKVHDDIILREGFSYNYQLAFNNMYLVPCRLAENDVHAEPEFAALYDMAAATINNAVSQKPNDLYTILTEENNAIT